MIRKILSWLGWRYTFVVYVPDKKKIPEFEEELKKKLPYADVIGLEHTMEIVRLK